MTGRVPLVAAAALVAMALVLSACSTGTADESRSRSAGDARAASGPAAASTAPGPDLEPAAPVDGGLPDLELPCLGEGPALNLADLRGVPTVVNVWAAWCTNCEREMPLFAAARARAGDRVRFLGVHYKAPRDYGLQSEVDFGVPFPSVHDEDGDRVVRELGAYAPPQTFFVAADGRVVGRKIGEIASGRELAVLVEEHLEVSL